MNTIALIPIYYRSFHDYQQWYEKTVNKATDHEIKLRHECGQDTRDVERIRTLVSSGIPTWKFNEQIGFIELGYWDDEVAANVWLDHHMYPYSGTREPPNNPRFAHARRPRYEQFEHMAFHFRLNDSFDPLGDNTIANEVSYRLNMIVQNYQENQVFQARTKKIWFDLSPTLQLVQAIDWVALLTD